MSSVAAAAFRPVSWADRVAAVWWKYELPTVFFYGACYFGWFLVIWYHAVLPWWAVAILGTWLVAWQFSIQHESIHALRHWPKWLRYAINLPPLGLWMPYPVYRRSHSKHHINVNLTDPAEDPESYYMPQARWAALMPITRALYLANQTFAGRLILGPFIRLYRLSLRETRRILRGDFINASSWAWHIVLAGGLIYFITQIAGMPIWKYLLLIAYPAFSLGLVRAFIEHKWGDLPKQRTVICEAGFLMSWLFLWNNLHAVHHLKPVMPWYEIPEYYRANKQKILEHNGHYLFPGGYWEQIRRWLFRPVFIPSHPAK